jgi:hypothetical protein
MHDAWATARECALLNEAFEHDTARLFRGEVRGCIITLSTRCWSANGYFCARQFESRRDDETIDEIGLNPRTFKSSSDVDILESLVHELVHLRQHHTGRPGRRGYHDREWADRMERVGLMSSGGRSRGIERMGPA